MPATGHRRCLLGIFMRYAQYCTDRRCNLRSTMLAMRLHPHRQGGAPKINSDPSPFGIYNLASPLDLIARPEDCAGKVLLPNGLIVGEFPQLPPQSFPSRKRINLPGRHSASRLLLVGFPELPLERPSIRDRSHDQGFSRAKRHSALDRDLADIRGDRTLAKSVFTVYQEQHLASRSLLSETALDPDPPR
jgi:hypothetical protein